LREKKWGGVHVNKQTLAIREVTFHRMGTSNLVRRAPPTRQIQLQQLKLESFLRP
jgi:hypothetical protein